jgi:hypothetical protein
MIKLLYPDSGLPLEGYHGLVRPELSFQRFSM